MKTAILGCGNLGISIVKGLLKSGFPAENIIATRRNPEVISFLKDQGVQVTSNNAEAIQAADIVIVTLKPYNILKILAENRAHFTPEKTVVSMATGKTLQELQAAVGAGIPVLRAMPNTAADVGESVTCLCGTAEEHKILEVENILESIGPVIRIDESLMEAATVLGACGIAYVLRFMRAMVQGGIQIGFDTRTATKIVNQTVLGAAKMLTTNGLHPEAEIDKVTTPKGCTIVGLNEMEHNGFSSSLIKGINASYREIEK